MHSINADDNCLDLLHVVRGGGKLIVYKQVGGVSGAVSKQICLKTDNIISRYYGVKTVRGQQMVSWWSYISLEAKGTGYTYIATE